jgi:hypothetical protein
MLQSSYEYSPSIDAKGENHTTESLLMTFIWTIQNTKQLLTN